ncbi:enoyl-CoA hydratase-related protein [Nocardia nova]|jgi:enoyl-CoA hydratase/carnithine racemase|uniref:enoyl-CoA hydratase-related protein n=1 Tax=Nocardia nova TaxID=37330 RepID=UPI001894B432|nr:enoyl-CoA hydratase-related protein [Nocardia nova]MBF6148872.1 enoyl-CoA hydratase/isomerase family protein [Nocardia nova]MDN2495555.1 enoyl-CoA hydratase [Nocardia nova]
MSVNTETAAAEDDPVLIERRGDIAIVRLHRPDRLNAFTDEMCERIIAAFDETDADDTIRAVVLTGTGRAFCAGADLAAGGDTFVLGDDPDTGGAPADQGGRVTLRIYRSLKPVIAAVNGPAAGVGVTMTLPADIRIASDTAKFGFVFTRRGLVPEACSTWFLPRIVGIATALEWTLNGRMVSAADALDYGLVRELVPPDQVVNRATELARELISGTAPVSVALTRQLMWRMLGAESPEIAHRAESQAIYVRGVSDDVREGVESFLAKRDPQFPDRVSGGVPDLFDFQPR